MSNVKTFTGRSRHRHTRRSVKIVDRIARTLIAIGGIGTVVAVSTVCIFLVWVVVPLFLPATAGQAKSVSLPSAIADCVHFEVDEYRALGWCLSAAGKLRTFRLDDGSVIAEARIICRGPTYRLVIRHRRA